MKTFKDFITEVSKDTLWSYYNKAYDDIINKHSLISKSDDKERARESYNTLRSKREKGKSLAYKKMKRISDKEELNDSKNDSPELSNYRERLKQHDWHFRMSEDPSHYKKGMEDHTHLQHDSQKSPKHRQLFNYYDPYHKE